MGKPIKIAAIGTYIPEGRQSNYPKAKQFGYEDQFIDQKLGFQSIAVKDREETTFDMCYEAVKKLDNIIDLKTKDIQLVTVVSQNPSQAFPHMAAMIHNKLNLNENCMTFDIAQACSGYIHALEIAKTLMDTQQIDYALVCTTDSYRDIINEDDRNVSMIFGDGATATLLCRSSEPGYEILDSTFKTLPNSYECLVSDGGVLRMDGRSVFNYAAKEVPRSIEVVLDKYKLDKEDLDLILFHQGSKFIVDSLTKLIRIPAEKTEFGSSNYGNTASSSIPLLLSKYFGKNAKCNVVLCGFGSGFTLGTSLLKFN